MSPVVPRRSPAYVPTEPLPGIRPPASAFEPPAPIDISPVTKLAESIYNEEQQKADHAAILGADTSLAQLSNQLLYDPQSGALTRRGEDAAPAHRDAMDAWTKQTSKIEQTLSENQRPAFQKIAQGRTEDFDRILSQHAATEIQRSIVDKGQANLDAERAATLQSYATLGDLTRVDQGIEHQRNSITLAGHLLGEPPEVTKQKIAEEVSRIHTGVLSLMIGKEQDLAAAKYYQAHTNELEPAALLELQGHLDLASLRGESQRRSDSILASTATFGGALAEVVKIGDPKLRDATRERVKATYEDREADMHFQRDEAFSRAGQVLEQTHDLNKIAPADWLKLSVGDRETLKNREDQIRYPRRDTNPDLYFSLMNMAGLSEASRQQFQGLNLADYRGQLSPAHLDALVRLQRSGRIGADKDAKKAAVAAEKRARADQILQQIGVTLPPSAPGAPLRAPAAAGSGSGIDLRQPTNRTLRPYVSPADIEHAKRDPKFRAYLLHMGAQLP